MLKFNCVPNYSNSPFQMFDVNFESLSSIIVVGIPCNLNISLIILFAMLTTLCVDFTEIK
jgi:hypothetical protein